jgi:hypothetical protein
MTTKMNCTERIISETAKTITVLKTWTETTYMLVYPRGYCGTVYKTEEEAINDIDNVKRLFPTIREEVITVKATTREQTKIVKRAKKA